MSLSHYLVAAAITLLPVVGLLWKLRPRRPREEGVELVYVNQDGSVREVSQDERAYLKQEFSGGDGGRPYIKSSYECRDGWGSQSGFMSRRRVPSGVPILPVHPLTDEPKELTNFDPLGVHRAVGDLIETNADGSITCTPNPDLSVDERMALSRKYMLEEQRRRESLAAGDF